MKYSLKGDKRLEQALYKKSKARFYGVANKSLVEIFNRAKDLLELQEITEI